MKIKKSCLIFLSILILIMPFKAEASSIDLIIENDYVDVNPINDNGRTLVPLRVIFESLGANVEWVKETKTIIGMRGSDNIKLQVGSDKAYINGTEFKLDVKPRILDGITYVPTRFIAESLGANVEWDKNSRTVLVDSNKSAIKPKKENTKETKVSKAYPYDLSDNLIKEAMNIGNKGFVEAFEYENKHYTLNPKTLENTMFIEGVQIQTAYNLILRKSALAKEKFQKYSFNEAKKINSDIASAKAVFFEVKILGSTLDMHRNTTVALKQGDKIIPATSIEGKDRLASMTNSWPKFPQYMAILNIGFENIIEDKIDFSKSAELIVKILPGVEVRYDVNFKNYK